MPDGLNINGGAMDPISLSLGALAASFIAKAVEHAGERSADGASSALGQLVSFLRKRFSDGDAGSALARVEDAPDSPSRLRDLAAVIDEQAVRDEAFRDELGVLVEQARTAGVDIGSISQTAWGNQNVQAAGITDSDITVTYGQPPTTPRR